MRTLNQFKQKALLLLLLTGAFTACHKPEPGVVPSNGETTDTLVKKYLVKQLLNDDPERVMLAIDWNDDFSKILHVKHGLGHGSILDYDFTYFNDDSIRVVFSMPHFSYPMWSFWYDSIMIHLQHNRIDSVCCYDDGGLRHVDKYRYDDEGRIIERTYLYGTKDTFRWDGDNVVEACLLMKNHEYDSFTGFIHPHYNLPYYLSNYVSNEAPQPLFTPLWKYMPESDDYDYEADEDNYVVKAKSTNTGNFHTYYYETAN